MPPTDLKVSTAVIYTPALDVLLQKKAMGYPWFPGRWCLFGGRQEPGEDPKETLGRELGEELSIDVNPSSLVYLMEQEFQDTWQLPGDKQGIVRTGMQTSYSFGFDGDFSDLHLREGAGLALFAQQETANYAVEHDETVLKRFFAEYST
jgi:8-oxo-dGTP pyrophosphatase MutT (NUDIX family)